MLLFNFFLSVLFPLNSAAIDYVDRHSFDDVRFRFSGNSIPDTVYNYDYWILYVYPSSYSDTSKYCYGLYLIADNSYENFGSVEGSLYFYTDTYPYNTKLNAVYTGNPGPSLDYEQSTEYPSVNSSFITSSDGVFSLRGWTNSFPSSYVGGWVFDNYNFDKFPTYQGSSSNYTSKIVLASNVDIYNQYGQLLQYGNYYTLLQYFCGVLDSSKITDYSGHEIAPGVVVESTTGSSSDGTSQEQLETSKGIFGTVKNIFDSLSELPSKIANAISGFFTTLKDGIIDGLKFLFIPSENLFDNLKDKFFSKFGFISQLSSLVYDLRSITYDDKPPENKITLYGVTVNFVNWEFYDDYRELINNIIIIISYYIFFWNIRRRLPDIIGGSYKL